MEYFRRLKNFWFPNLASFIWLILALPALYFFQTTIHEGSHAVAAFFATGNFPKVAPFPHESPEGYFRNGVTLGDSSTSVMVEGRTSCESFARTRFSKLGGFIAAPQMVDLALVACFTILFFITSPANPAVHFILRTWYLGAILDFCYNTARGLIGGCNAVTDWSRFYLQSEMSLAVFAVLTWVLWLAVFSHFIWVYWSRWSREPAGQHGFWDYRWLGFVLGCLALAAVLLSIFINDPEINKSSALFIVPLVVQCAALVWYWVYFGLTFRPR